MNFNFNPEHTFFTSDTHFNHANIIKFCNRPFKDVEQMNETLIANWNRVVEMDDTVFHAGRLQYLFPTQYDVGVDNNDFTPVSFEQVQRIINKQIENTEECQK